MNGRFGQVMGIAGVALCIAGIAFWSSARATRNATMEPGHNWEALHVRAAKAEAKIAALERTVDELQTIVLMGSARLERRVQALEAGTRPIINIEKGTVYGGGRELVIQGVEK